MRPAWIAASITLLSACTTPAPEDVVWDALTASGATRADARARWPDGLTADVAAHPDPCRITVTTRGWRTLTDAAGPAGVARALTELAARNREQSLVQLGLDAAEGHLDARVILWCAGGLPPEAATDAIDALRDTTTTLAPILDQALTAAPL